MNEQAPEVVTFSVDGHLYAVKMRCVQELLWLPSISPLEEQPAYILGSFDLRGELVRLVDLNLRLGHPTKPISAAQIAVVVRTRDGLVGLLGDELIDSGLANMIQGQATSVSGSTFKPLVQSQFEMDGRIGTLIDPDELVAGDRFPFEYLIERTDPLAALCDQDLNLLAERQRAYRLAPEEGQAAANRSVAIVRISDEYFGLDVAGIQEFAYLAKIFSLPGTPDFVLGNTNLRGEIVTVFDISSLLGVDPVRIREESRLVVFSYEQQPLAFLVDDLIDVCEVDPQSIQPLPIAIPEERRAWTQGEFRYQQGSVILIDTQRIFDDGRLVVEQA